MIFPVFLFSFLLIAQSNALTGRARDTNSPFRMNKLNVLWQKAQKKMSEQKLADLRRLLELQDRAEIKWKDLKANGGDEDGEMEATLRRKFYRILEQFGLEKHYDRADDGNEIRDNTAGRGVFGDKRLSELWESAKKQGKFNSEELSDLQTEFNHHRDKLKEYNRLLKVLMEQDEISENSVLSKENLKEELLKKLQDKLQDSHADLTDSFAKLKEKATGEKVHGEFRDPRVNELWEKAQTAKFTEEELDSIKQELYHFDHKIMKHKHFRKEAEESRRLVDDGQHHFKEKHEKLAKRAEEHGRWVKKMHSTLMDKVAAKIEL